MEQTDLLENEPKQKVEGQPDQDPPKLKDEDSESLSNVQKDLEVLRQKMRQTEEENKKLKDEIQAANLKSLKEQENWQEIAKVKEEEADYYKDKYESLGKSVISERKYIELKAAAVSAGLRQEALEDLALLNIDDYVSHETTSTGRINVIGTKQAVDKLKASRPHWFASSRRNINSSHDDLQTVNAPSEGEVTIAMVMEAEKKARETGDKKAKEDYFNILKKYQSKRS